MAITENCLAILAILAITIFVVALAATRSSWQRFWRQYHSPIFKAIYVVLRVVLPLGVCLLAWLSVQQAVELAHLKRDLIQVLQQMPGIRVSLEPPNSRALGFFWQHLSVLPVFTVSIAVATLLYSFVAKVQRRAFTIAAVALVVLLIQVLVVAPALAKPALELEWKLERMRFHQESHAAYFSPDQPAVPACVPSSRSTSEVGGGSPHGRSLTSYACNSPD